MIAATRTSFGNRILDSLPHEEFVRLLPHLELVVLEKGEIVYITGDDIQFAYFPINGLLSLVSTTETGSTIEVAMVSSEGAVGLPVILGKNNVPYEVTVQFPTSALKIRAKALQEEFDRGQKLQDFVLRYLNVLFAQISQSIICNRFHSLDATLSRWLLTVQDRINSDHLDLTQETISNTLGVPRTAVTTAAGALQKAGIIRYSRGKISILDRAGLEKKSCECYRIIRSEFAHFLKNS
jgi:CRP-like cAMP-binding protein